MPSKFSFSLALSVVGPPGWQAAPVKARGDLLRAMLAFGLEEKDRDLAQGLGADGQPLARLSIKTIQSRRSAMGPADPGAPPLIPAHGLSRTRALLTGQVSPSKGLATFWWKVDPRVGTSWGRVLDYHRRGEGHLPVRDVFGFSPAALARIRQRLASWWARHQLGLASVPIAATPAALPDPSPAFLVETVPAHQPKNPANAVPKNPMVVSQIRVNGKVYTIGAGVGGRASAASIRRAIARGKFSGFTRHGNGDGQPLPPPASPFGPKPTPAPTGPKPTPKTKPKPTPVAATAIATATPKVKVKAKPTFKPKPTPGPAPSTFPKDPNALRVVRTLGGSTGAELVEDLHGNRFVRKRGTSPGHLREEATADALYRAAGVDVPAGKLYETASGPVKLARFVEGVPLGELRRTDPDAAARAEAKLREHFALDALLGNWDVVGLDADNALVAPDGRVYRIDNGGALRYRARGQAKGDQWTGQAEELKSLRNPSVNPSAARVFASLSDAQVKAQVKTLWRSRAKILDAAPNDLKATLQARFEAAKAWVDARPPRLPRGFKAPDPAAFRAFDAEAAADEWGKREWKHWGAALSKAERDQLRRYTSSGYQTINARLRATARTADEGRAAALLDPDIALLTHALERARVPEPVVAWRGIQDLRKLNIADAADLVPGMRIEESAFASTSLRRKVSQDFASNGPRPVLFKVFMDRSTPGAFVNAAGKASAHPSEVEVLLPPGAGRYIVFRGPRPGESPPEVWVQWIRQ